MSIFDRGWQEHADHVAGARYDNIRERYHAELQDMINEGKMAEDEAAWATMNFIGPVKPVVPKLVAAAIAAQPDDEDIPF